MAILLIVLQRFGKCREQLIKLYIVAYLFYRFVSAYIRPEVPLILGLTGYQWSALALLRLFVYLWQRDAEWFRVENGELQSPDEAMA